MIRPALSTYFLLLVVAFHFPVTVRAQSKKSSILRFDTTAHVGKLLLTNGAQLNGRIVFNDNEGIVTIINGNDSQSFTSRRIAKFEFYDRSANRYKRFYSLEYTDPETGLTDTNFFEVLKELDRFIVLAKIDRIKIESRQQALQPKTSPLLVDRKAKKATQTQTIYFVNNNGDFEPYVKILEKEIGGELLDINETHNRYIKSSLFQKYTGEYYEELEKYAKQHKLSFKRKTDIIKILDQYEQISKR